MNNSAKVLSVISQLTILCLAGIFVGYIYLLGGTILDPGDGINHFLIAKYSWENPMLFFDHWGKPIFTILSSPFAQFGFKGMILFNIILFVYSSIILLKIAKSLKLSYGFIAVAFCFIAPVYFRGVLSGLTEVLFSAIVITSVLLFLRKSYILGTILVSFSILARPESSLIIPFFVVYLLVKKQYKVLPFLATGFVLFSILGLMFGKDLFWILTERPYSSSGTYGVGNLGHFILNYRNTLGIPLTFFFLLGVISWLKNMVRNKDNRIAIFSDYGLLLVLPILAVVAGHSIMWWKGLQGSAGLLRVITTVIPLIAVVAIYGLNEYLVLFNKYIKIKEAIIISGLVLFATVFIVKRSWKLELNQNMVGAEQLLSDAAFWYSSQNYTGKTYFMPPYFAYETDINPFNEETKLGSLEALKNNDQPSSLIGSDDVIMWETQFSPLEAEIELEQLFQDSNLTLVQSFYADSFIEFGGQPYQIHFFKKTVNK
jgi:hypothetical protein